MKYNLYDLQSYSLPNTDITTSTNASWRIFHRFLSKYIVTGPTIHESYHTHRGYEINYDLLNIITYYFGVMLPTLRIHSLAMHF